MTPPCWWQGLMHVAAWYHEAPGKTVMGWVGLGAKILGWISNKWPMSNSDCDPNPRRFAELMHVYVLMWRFSEGKNRILLQFWRLDKCYRARHSLYEVYQRQWSCLSPDRLLWGRWTTDFLYWQLDSRTDIFKLSCLRNYRLFILLKLLQFC